MGETEEFPPRPIGLCRLGRRRRPPESHSLFVAVDRNNLEKLKTLLQSGQSVNSKNTRGNTLLHHVIAHQRVEMFDYLLSCEDLLINGFNSFGQNSFLYTATKNFDEYFTLELMKKGADIHAVDNAGFGFLHLCVKNRGDEGLQLGQLVIEKGVDVDAQGSYGVTPLYAACEEGCVDWIHMLLYYGASALIPSANGVLPVAVLSRTIAPDQRSLLEETLFNHTFDGVNSTVKLPTLVVAMALDSSLFSKIVAIASDVSYDMSDLKHLYSFLTHVKAKHFRLFVDKFGAILSEMVEIFAPLTMLVSFRIFSHLPELRDILWIFLESECVCDFVQTSDPLNPTVGRLVQMFNKSGMFVVEEEVAKMVYVMLTNGLNVTSPDLDMVYSNYGYCDLFKILLHMEIYIDYGIMTIPMAALYYDPSIELEVFFNQVGPPLELLNYYNHPRLKDILSSVSEEHSDKVKTLPPVPLLTELSRNVVRKYLVSRYNLKNSMQFHTVLKWLPIGEMTKKIIALETELY